MNRPSQIALIAAVMATGAVAWAQSPPVSSVYRAAQEQGSQLVPEAQPPFSPVSGNTRAAPANTGRADDKLTSRQSPVAVERGGSGSDIPAPSGQCDLRLCASTYRSFRASDCTYQPYTGGPRQLCER